MPAIQKVWIEDGCISCSLCMDIVPEVFKVPDGEKCKVLPDAGKQFEAKYELIKQAAEDCPVEVIKVTEV